MSPATAATCAEASCRDAPRADARGGSVRAPDLTGVARVWRLARNDAMQAAHVKSFGYASSSLADWVANGPYHPFWSWWYIGLVHLRDVPGAPPANKQYPEAQYELMFLSLNPDGRNGGKVDVDKIEAGDIEGGLPGFLTPPDLVYQFHGVTDEQAIKIVERAVEHIAAGQSCDSDFRSWWRSSLDTTVQHYREGRHS
jgi:hypothetical protein